MRRLVVLAACLALAACTTKHTTFTGELKLGKTAEENYKAGLEELSDGNHTEAIRFFEYVRTKYPFDRHSALAELRLADVKYDQDRYAEAAEAYKQFVTLHPTHSDVDYARYREGLSLFKDAPGDFALFPPAHEKDQRQTEAAVQVLADFVRDEEAAAAERKQAGADAAPPSKHVDDAKKVLAEARARLAAREWYVAEYYFKRERWAGAAGRYQALVDRFPGSPHQVAALLKLSEAYAAMGEKHKGREALQRLLAEHPRDPARAEAERRLAALR